MIDEQYRDMVYGSHQYPEAGVVLSLDAVVSGSPDGRGTTWGELVDEEGCLMVRGRG